jgi:hypothetical protein
VRSALVIAFTVLIAASGCGGSQHSGVTPSADPQALVLRTEDLPRGYQYGDDTGCGGVSANEGDWPKLRPLFAEERPDACMIQLEWAWRGQAPLSRGVTSAAYRFRDEDGARRGFDARDELFSFTASLDVRASEGFRLGDEAELVRGHGLNNPATGVVWRTGPVVAVLVVEPADEAAVKQLAEKQNERIQSPLSSPVRPVNDAEVELDDPSLELPVHWLGRTFDPPGRLPRLDLDLARIGGDGPGQSVQLGYAGGVTLDTWTPHAWARFSRTRLGRLIWDSPCARKHVVQVTGGHAELFEGYGAPNPVERPCPQSPTDRAIAHVYYGRVVVVVNMPYCYMCARPAGHNPYNSVAALEKVVRALRLRSR